MHKFIISLTAIENISFDILQAFRDALETNGYGVPEWSSSNTLTWNVVVLETGWEDELFCLAAECNVPQWFLSVANGGIECS